MTDEKRILFKVEGSLKERFGRWCRARGLSMSAALRLMMRKNVGRERSCESPTSSPNTASPPETTANTTTSAPDGSESIAPTAPREAGGSEPPSDRAGGP